MARPVWPPSINDRPLADAYAETMPNQIRRSTATEGPAKTRRRAGMRPIVIHPKFFFETRALLDAFFEWIYDVNTGLAGGVIAFEWTHPVNGKTLVCRFVPDSDEEMFTTTMPYTTSRLWQVATKIEVLP